MFDRSLAVGIVFALAVAGCSNAPTAPTSPPTTVPPPTAPQAVLTIGDGINPPLAVAGGTPLMFDASASTGAGPLTYTIEFGDGSSESRMIARHALPMRAGGGYSLQAKLTVTDALGRSASVTREYFAAALEQPSGTFWYHLDGKVKTSLVFDLNGTELSGWYKYGVAPAQRFTGSLTGERTFSLRTDDGQVEFQGAVEWKADPRTFLSSFGVVLRVVGTRGALQGTTLDFSFADPY